MSREELLEQEIEKRRNHVSEVKADCKLHPDNPFNNSCIQVAEESLAELENMVWDDTDDRVKCLSRYLIVKGQYIEFLARYKPEGWRFKVRMEFVKVSTRMTSFLND